MLGANIGVHNVVSIESRVNNHLISAYLSLILFSHFFDAVYSTESSFIFLNLVLMPGALLAFRIILSNKYFLLFISTVLILLICISLIRQQFLVKFFYYILFSIWAVDSIYKIRLPLIYPVSFLLTILVIVVEHVIIQNLDPSKIFANGSRNLLSFYALYAFALIALLCYVHKINTILLLVCAFFMTLVCILAIGRTGIILSTVLTLSLIFSNYLSSMGSLLKFSLLVSTLIIFAIFFVDFSIISELFRLLEGKLGRLITKGLENSYRASMINNYMNSLENVEHVLFGYDYTKDDFFIGWDLNPHNSFIRLHSYTGLFGLLVFLFLMIGSALSFMKNNFFMAVMLFSLVIRAFFDTIAFFSALDFVLLAYLFYLLYFWFVKEYESSC